MKHEITSQNTKRMLAEALKSLMQKKSLSKITISEIVNSCQINRKTFYYHFTDIYDLLEWLLNQEMAEILNSPNPLDDFDATLQFFMDYLEQSTWLLSCADDLAGCDRLMQFFNRKLYPVSLNIISRLEQRHNKYLCEDYKCFLANLYAKVSALSLVDAIKNKDGINREQVVLYISDTLQSSLDGIFYTMD